MRERLLEGAAALVRDAVRANKGGVLNSWSVILTRGVGPAPLAAAAAGPGTTAILSESQVAPLLTEAVARWQAAGADTSSLAGVQVRVADLGGTTLGLASGNTISPSGNARIQDRMPIVPINAMVKDPRELGIRVFHAFVQPAQWPPVW